MPVLSSSEGGFADQTAVLTPPPPMGPMGPGDGGYFFDERKNRVFVAVVGLMLFALIGLVALFFLTRGGNSEESTASPNQLAEATPAGNEVELDIAADQSATVDPASASVDATSASVDATTTTLIEDSTTTTTTSTTAPTTTVAPTTTAAPTTVTSTTVTSTTVTSTTVSSTTAAPTTKPPTTTTPTTAAPQTAAPTTKPPATTRPPRTTRQPATTRRQTTAPPSTTAPTTTAAPVTQAPSGGGSAAQQVLALTNSERARAGCGPLSLNGQLNSAALAHSEDMRANNYFDHTGLNGSKPWDRAAAAGYGSSTIGENIAAGYRTADSVMNGWMNSPGHRANILNCSYNHLGVGLSSQGNYWTQLFGGG